jgi:hypothetical protein
LNSDIVRLRLQVLIKITKLDAHRPIHIQNISVIARYNLFISLIVKTTLVDILACAFLTYATLLGPAKLIIAYVTLERL